MPDELFSGDDLLRGPPNTPNDDFVSGRDILDFFAGHGALPVARCCIAGSFAPRRAPGRLRDERVEQVARARVAIGERL